MGKAHGKGSLESIYPNAEKTEKIVQRNPTLGEGKAEAWCGPEGVLVSQIDISSICNNHQTTLQDEVALGQWWASHGQDRTLTRTGYLCMALVLLKAKLHVRTLKMSLTGFLGFCLHCDQSKFSDFIFH